jgi:hypothetical protein
MSDTLLLDQAEWDLVLNAQGNIAMASDPYSLVQDVSSAIRLFIGELWYDTTQGIPYFENILGHRPSLQYVRIQIVKAALTVPTIVSAKCTITAFENRDIQGYVQITDAAGTVQTVTF